MKPRPVSYTHLTLEGEEKLVGLRKGELWNRNRPLKPKTVKKKMMMMMMTSTALIDKQRLPLNASFRGLLALCNSFSRSANMYYAV